MIAIDTNALIYAIDKHDLAKWMKARELVNQLRAGSTATVSPWQVLAEFTRYLRSREDRALIARRSLLRYVSTVREFFPLAMPSPRVLDLALTLSERYSLSHWDSMLLGACVEIGVDTLYTEDMGSPTRVDNVLLLNPFT